VKASSAPDGAFLCKNRFEIRQLHYFLEVADAGSFSRPAKRLGVTQPAISQQMRDLEKGLRAVLLQRRGKRNPLTPAGLLLQGHARAILRQLGQSLQGISAAKALVPRMIENQKS